MSRPPVSARRAERVTVTVAAAFLVAALGGGNLASWLSSAVKTERHLPVQVVALRDLAVLPSAPPSSFVSRDVLIAAREAQSRIVGLNGRDALALGQAMVTGTDLQSATASAAGSGALSGNGGVLAVVVAQVSATRQATSNDADAWDLATLAVTTDAGSTIRVEVALPARPVIERPEQNRRGEDPASTLTPTPEILALDPADAVAHPVVAPASTPGERATTAPATSSAPAASSVPATSTTTPAPKTPATKPTTKPPATKTPATATTTGEPSTPVPALPSEPALPSMSPAPTSTPVVPPSVSAPTTGATRAGEETDTASVAPELTVMDSMAGVED